LFHFCYYFHTLLYLRWNFLYANFNVCFKAEKRAHHNALERRRRDHIKESFTNLREAVPTLKGEKVIQKSNR